MWPPSGRHYAKSQASCIFARFATRFDGENTSGFIGYHGCRWWWGHRCGLGTTGLAAAAVTNPVGWCVAGITLWGNGTCCAFLCVGFDTNPMATCEILTKAFSFCKTTGDYHRWKVAVFIFSAVVLPRHGRVGARHNFLVGRWLGFVGGKTVMDLQWEITQMGVQGLIAFMRLLGALGACCGVDSTDTR